MVATEHIIVLKVSINGLTLYKSESLAVTKVFIIVEIIYQSDFVIYHLGKLWYKKFF